MQTNATARILKERRSETRNHVKNYYNVQLSIDGLDLTNRFKIWDRTTTSISFLIKKHLDILPRLKVGGTLYMNYSPTDSSYPRVCLMTIIRHVTKCNQRGLKRGLNGNYLVGLKILEKQVAKKGSEVVASLSDNGGRRAGIDRRQFSYDAHVPERRSGMERRSSVDRRNGLFMRMSPREWSDIERRAGFL